MRFLRPYVIVFGTFLMILSYLLCFPLFVIGLRYLSNYRPLIGLSRRLCQLWLLFSGLRWRLDYEVVLKSNQSYVLCANHSSYLDIPAVFLIKLPLVFVGNSAWERVPLFGYMYKRMHILANRLHLHKRYKVLERAKDTIYTGKSLVFFPEGGIRSKYPPCLAPFKKGAFRSAIATQVAVVPVTILYNWMIMPKYPRTPPHKPYNHLIHLKIHAPISTKGLREEDTSSLMQQVRSCIERPLRESFSTLFEEKDSSTK